MLDFEVSETVIDNFCASSIVIAWYVDTFPHNDLNPLFMEGNSCLSKGDIMYNMEKL